MSNGEDEDKPKVTWGTANLKSGFNGVVVEARIQKSEKGFDDKEPADQLFLKVRPTSYEEEDDTKWPRHWYNLSTSRRSKWAALQEALEKCGALPKESEEELIGKEFVWERKDLDFGVNKKTGVRMTADEVMLPTKFIRDTKKKTPAGASKAPATPEASAPVAPKEEMDPEMVVVEMVTKEPMELEKLYKKASMDFGLRRADTYKAIMGAQKKGLVKLNKEENTLAAIE